MLTVVAILLFLAAYLNRGALLPGDPKVTAQALESLRMEIVAGEPVGEALAAFCREIVDGADLEE